MAASSPAISRSTASAPPRAMCRGSPATRSTTAFTASATRSSATCSAWWPCAGWCPAWCSWPSSPAAGRVSRSPASRAASLIISALYLPLMLYLVIVFGDALDDRVGLWAWPMLFLAIAATSFARKRVFAFRDTAEPEAGRRCGAAGILLRHAAVGARRPQGRRGRAHSAGAVLSAAGVQLDAARPAPSLVDAADRGQPEYFHRRHVGRIEKFVFLRRRAGRAPMDCRFRAAQAQCRRRRAWPPISTAPRARSPTPVSIFR